MEVDEEALAGMAVQGLLELASQLGIVTNEVDRDNREALLQLIEQQTLNT